MRFIKAHAYGNDFLYIVDSEVDGMPLDALAQELCARHTGIGADGLIVYTATEGGAVMRLFNADGSRSEVSGNGVRALGAILAREAGDGPAVLTIQTDAGPKRLIRIAQDGVRATFRAEMGVPRDLRRVPITAAGETFDIVVMDFGNPQAVVLGALPDRARFERLGAAIERHSLFPEGTNVEFAEVDPSGAVRILIWERGVGPTESSGTGSCAALVAAASYGGAAREADVVAPGGAQRVEWRDDNVYLTGWAEVLFSGAWVGQIPRTP
jgi:diaminopimelate epimerase